MKTLFLVVNTICDMACKHCFYTVGYEKRSMSRIMPSAAQRLARKIREYGFEIVVLTGGDPLVSRFKDETYALIRELKKQSLKVIINTSGAKTTATDVESILELGVNRVDLSINSHIREIHNAERGFYDDAIWFLRQLLTKKPKIVSTTTVVTEDNAAHAADTLQWLKNMGVENINYQPVFAPSETQPSDVIVQALKDCARIQNAKHTSSYLAQYAAAASGQKPLPSSFCRMGEKYLVCDSDGSLYPCFHLMDVALGNIMTSSKQEVEAVIAQDFLHRSQPPACFGLHCVSLFDNVDFWR